MKKPTEKMVEVLRELAKPGVTAHYMRYIGSFNRNAYYFLSNTYGRCTKAIIGLRDRGLVESHRFKFGDHEIRISDAGRKWLEDNQ